MAGRYITVTAKDGGSFKAYLAAPEKGSGPGIVLLQEIFGINAYIRGVADYYAEEGYVVLAPDLFWRIEPGIELGFGDEDRKKAFAYREKFDVDKAVDDIGATVAALRHLPECKGKIGAIGFCLGGLLAYLSAARLGIDCAVSYYGVGIEKALGEAAKIKCPMVLHIAEKDKWTPPEVVSAIKGAFEGRPEVEIYVYPGVDHAFSRDGGSNFDKPAAMMAHSRSIALFHKVLGPIFNLSALWDMHRLLRVRHARRRRHHGDHGGAALCQPRADHDRRRRLQGAAPLLPASFRQFQPGRYAPHPDLAHHRRRSRGRRDDLLLHP